MDEREKIERTIEMLRYAIENNEQQLSMYEEGGLEWIYAKKLVESCRQSLAVKEEELAAHLKKEEGKAQ